MITKIKVGDLEINNTQASGYYIKELLTMGAGTKYSVAELLSRHGAKLGNAVYKNKSISVTVLIVGSSSSDLLDKRNALIKELKLDNYADDDKIKVTFYMANGGVISIYGVAKDINDDLNNELVGASTLNFMIESEKPFFLSETIYQKTVIITQGGGCAVPMSIPLDMSQGSLSSRHQPSPKPASFSAIISSFGNRFSTSISPCCFSNMRTVSAMRSSPSPLHCLPMVARHSAGIQ